VDLSRDTQMTTSPQIISDVTILQRLAPALTDLPDTIMTETSVKCLIMEAVLEIQTTSFLNLNVLEFASRV